MNLIVTIREGRRLVITASIEDAEAFAKLKLWAESEGYTVQIQEDDQERALRRVGKR
jgi:hypothetical protein